MDLLKTTTRLFAAAAAFSLLALGAGCGTLIHKSGEALEGSAFEEKALALYRSAESSGGADTADGRLAGARVELKIIERKNGGEAVEITSEAWPGFALRGEKPREAAGGFELSEARILSSHVHGWNDFTLDLLGSAVFWAPGESVGSLRIPGEVERMGISSGKIRLKNSRLAGDAALAPLRNRRERILALIEWMREDSAAAASGAGGEPPPFESLDAFAARWKPRLFPELVSRRRRPPEYAAGNAEWGRADGVKWNRTYTEFLFPEELRELRNSGGLLRDWEEALPWIYMEYSWSRLIGSFDNKILHKAK